MTALLRVISLVVISVVVIIIPPCGAALGRGKAVNGSIKFCFSRFTAGM
ncbi:MAG: ilv operon leader peptide [Citrobacter sp.]|nr:ilv operon leader peptide [Citrobacter sp.]